MLVCLSASPFTGICSSVYLLVCLSACLFICLSVYLLVCLSACLFICLAACLIIFFLVCLFACLYNWLYVCLFFLQCCFFEWRVAKVMMMQGPGTCQAKQKRLTHHQRETKMKTTKYFFSTTFWYGSLNSLFLFWINFASLLSTINI